MSKARTLHQSVLLQDGKVLVIGGGDSDYEPIASVDIYDPSAGTWTETSELIKARQEHTATVLSDGRVLVTGGGRIDATETSEIYDPSTGAWSEAGEMIAGRIAGVSALLDDGRVLIAGGRGGYQWLAVSVRMAEIYDPATNSWSTAGDLLDIRHDHAATILSDGRVMVTGGVIAEGMGVRTLPMAEIYEATTNAWTATAGLSAGTDGPLSYAPVGRQGPRRWGQYVGRDPDFDRGDVRPLRWDVVIRGGCAVSPKEAPQGSAPAETGGRSI